MLTKPFFIPRCLTSIKSLSILRFHISSAIKRKCFLKHADKLIWTLWKKAGNQDTISSLSFKPLSKLHSTRQALFRVMMEGCLRLTCCFLLYLLWVPLSLQFLSYSYYSYQTKFVAFCNPSFNQHYLHCLVVLYVSYIFYSFLLF